MGTLAVLVLICAFSLLFGHAACAACGRDPRANGAPAVGLAILLILAWITVRLPGHTTTGIAVIAFAAVVSVAYLVWSSALRVSGDTLLVAAVALLAALVPFFVNARFGILGVSVNNDLAVHMTLAQYFLDGHPELANNSGYPTGPHALVAIATRAAGTNVALGFSGLLAAIPPLTAITALGGLPELSVPRKVLAAPLVALAYLVAAYYGQGAYKETILGMLVLAFVLYLRDATSGRIWALSGWSWLLALIPAGLLIAGMVETYSYLGFAWPLAALSIWALVAVIPRLSVARVREHASDLAKMALALGVMAGLAVASQWHLITREFHQLGFSPAGHGAITTTNLGNLPHPLSAFEMLGIWLSGDFRLYPANVFHAGIFGGLALAVTVASGLWWVRRRDYTVPAAVVGSVAIYYLTRRSQSPYVAAKALAVAAPLIMLMNCRALLARRRGTGFFDDANLARLAIGGVFVVAAVTSSYYSLRNTQVGPLDHARELGSLRSVVEGKKVLYLGYDDYVPWELHGSSAVYAIPGGVSPPGGNPKKPFGPEQPYDWDNVLPSTLDTYDYAITSRTDYTSEPPRNFRLVRTTRSFELWRRDGPTPRRLTLAEAGGPGTRLDCRKPAGRRLSHLHGVATLVRPTVGTPAGGLWNGQAEAVPLKLSPGRWSISLQYTAPQPIHVSGAGLDLTMAPNLDRPGAFFLVGYVNQARAGTMLVNLSVRSPRFLHAKTPLASPMAVTATQVGRPIVTTLRAACGKVVDWYQVTPQRRATQ